MNLNWNKAFDSTLSVFGITAKWLSQQSGLSEVTISRFRKGKQPITTDSLSALLKPMSAEAQKYFFEYLIGEALEPRKADLEEIVTSEPQKAAAVLMAIANKYFPPAESAIPPKEEVFS